MLSIGTNVGNPLPAALTQGYPYRTAGVISLRPIAVHLVLRVSSEPKVAPSVVQPISINMIDLHCGEPHDDAMQKVAGWLSPVGINVSSPFGCENIPIYTTNKPNISRVNNGFISTCQGNERNISFNPDVPNGPLCHAHRVSPISDTGYQFAANRSTERVVM